MNKKIIFVVDDSDINRDVIEHMFQNDDDFEVIACENGNEALQKLSVLYENVGVLIADIIMPVMNGVELLKALKGDERYKQIPVIMLTSHTDEALVETCFLYGATDCIYKPFHPLVMRQRIQKILG